MRFYLHFCIKYKHNPADTKSIPFFIIKLESKNQAENQRAQAQAAVEYYRALLLPNPEHIYVESTKLAEPEERFKNTHASADKKLPDINTGWLNLETGLKNEIMLRHYSLKTLKSYQMWIRKFRGFLFNKDPSKLEGVDVKQFLTDLAVKK